jgi:vesicle coat complex subunit
MYITGLALSTIGSIASVEVSRDLTDEVEKLMENSNSYVRKKVNKIFLILSNLFIYYYILGRTLCH